METLDRLFLELSQITTAKTSRELDLEDLLVSAHCIAKREGKGTAWDIWSQRLANAGIGSVTARTFKTIDLYPAALAHGDKSPLAAHMQRVVDEQKALDEKLGKLTDFVSHNPLFRQCSEAEQDRLRRQMHLMCQYSCVLSERIAAFPVPG